MSTTWRGRPKVNGLTEEPVKLHKCTGWAMPAEHHETAACIAAATRGRGEGSQACGDTEGGDGPSCAFTNYRQS